MTNNQTQKAGDESVQIQAQTVNIQNGLTASEVREFAATVIKENLLVLRQEAEHTALERAASLIEAMIEVAIKRKIEDFSSLSTPRKQNDLFQAQKGFALSDANPDLKVVLTKLLIGSLENPQEQSLHSVITSEAIQVASSITANQIKILCALFIFNKLKIRGPKSCAELLSRLKIYFDILDSRTISFGDVDILHLEYLSCIQLEALSSNSVENYFLKQYPGLFSTGMPLSDYEGLPHQMIMPCINNSELFQIAATDKSFLERKAKDLNLTAQQLEIATKYLTNNLMNENMVADLISKTDHDIELINKWNKSALKRCRLSNVGTMIAHSFLSAKGLIEFELNF